MSTQQHTAEIVKVDTALNSFRDGGYSFEDMVGEYADNAIQSSATEFRVSWVIQQEGKKNPQRKATSIGIADNGNGIPINILPNCLTIGFGTRLNDRTGIGKYGVGFKLSTLSQAKRLTIYTMPRFLKAIKNVDEEDKVVWNYSDPNSENRIFKSYLDLDDIIKGNQTFFFIEEVDTWPDQYQHLTMSTDHTAYKNGTLFVIETLDRFNERKSYAEPIDQKFSDLNKFMARAFRKYIDAGFRIFLGDNQTESVYPYDPTFQIDNEFANRLARTHSMKGEYVEQGEFLIDDHKVEWKVFLTPAITRLRSQGGGDDGEERGDGQFKKLHIPENEGKISFLRRGREISYTIVPKFLPKGIEPIDRYIGIEIAFPPYLDEYFQVRHIKRGAEPVEKLRQQLRKNIEKPVLAARARIRELWAQTDKNEHTPPSQDGDFSGGRGTAQQEVKDVDADLPKGSAGMTVSPQAESEKLKEIAAEIGIQDPKEQQLFAENMKHYPIIAIPRSWPGKGLIDIEHLTNTVIVYLNNNHPFIKKVYLPLKRAIQQEELPESVVSALSNAIKGIDLLFFAYAKSENQIPNPEDKYGMLREDWGKFAAHYLKNMNEIDVR
jgi:Histidine kinase-, DNA gyrase B-, and HSP90-like ATPase